MAAAAAAPKLKLKLRSSDSQVFEVEEEVARESQTIREFLEATSSEDVIPLPIVSSTTLAKVIEYCEFHVKSKRKVEDAPAKSEEEIRSWDAEFVKVDQATLFDIILAANYLHIKPLLNLSCQTVAEAIKGKTPEEIRSTYNITVEPEEGEEEEEIEEGRAAKVPRLEEGNAEGASGGAAAEGSRAAGAEAAGAGAEGAGAAGAEAAAPEGDAPVEPAAA